MMKILLITLMAVGTVHAVKYDRIYDQDLSAPALKITKDDQGNWLEITTNEWHDVVYTDKGEKSYVYRQAYNYQSESGYLRTYTPELELVSEVKQPNGGGMVSREELLLSFDVFKKHPQIELILAKEKEPIKLFGGFGYVDNKPNQPCFQGKRCVHVFAHTDTKTMVAHAIVKLTDKTVPYPDFDGLYNKKEEKK